MTDISADNVNIGSAVVTDNSLNFTVNGGDRWRMIKTGAAETGGNAGSDFQWNAYTDTGAYLGNVLTIPRASQIVSFGHSPTAPTPANGDMSSNAATTQFVRNTVPFYPVYSQGNTALDDAPGINAAIAAVSSAGGGIVQLMPGVFTIKTSVVLQNNVILRGTRLGSILRAGANLTALVTQADITQPLYNITLDNLTIDCQKASFAVGKAVYLSPIGAKVDCCDIEHGTGDGLSFVRNGTADWINQVTRNTIGDFAGNGFYADFSDGEVFGNYISGCGIGIYAKQAGGVKCFGNQIEVCGEVGIWLDSDTGEDGWIITDNYFDQNAIALQIVNGYVVGGAPAFVNMMSPVCDNMFHRSSTGHIWIDSDIGYLQITGNVFDANAGTYDISFGTSNNAHLVVGPNTHVRALANRFVNLPTDLTMLSGGNDQLNLMRRLSLGGDGYAPADPTLSVFGTDTVNGYVNVAAQFGCYRNNSGVDAQTYIQVINGNEPTVNFGQGATTTPSKGNFQLNGATSAKITTGGGFSLVPLSSATPADNGDLCVQVSGGVLTFKYRNASGTVVSSGPIPLS